MSKPLNPDVFILSVDWLVVPDEEWLTDEPDSAESRESLTSLFWFYGPETLRSIHLFHQLPSKTNTDPKLS